MLKLEIIYSKEFEINQVIDTFQQSDWFHDNGYKVTLPTKLRSSYENGVLTDNIEIAVQEDFDEKYYQEQKDFLVKNLEKVFSQATDEFAKTGLTILDKYKIFLTRYGTGGSYSLPDKVIINIDFFSGGDLLLTAIHEIVHLVVEPLVNLYQINHWTKERFVDLIIAQIVPSLKNFQNLPINTEAIDDVFAKNYPEIKKIFKGVAELN